VRAGTGEGGMRSLRASFSGLLAALCAAGGIAGTLGAAVPAWAQDCPGNPDALGTSRVLVLEPGGPTRFGVMQYAQTLPLAAKEVVLTFDDGPMPRYSNKILDILAEQCVLATYFLVGEMARAYPATVRRIYQAGHSIGTHSEDHPTGFGKLPIEKMRWEIDQGIADVIAALGDPNELAPFFRIPGLARSEILEDELAARSLIVFSSDTVADDWHRRIKPAQIVRRAMSRLEARGKGILLLHDIHPATVAALPELLKQLKKAGFRVVHVVPAPAPPVEVADALASSLPLHLDDRADPHWPTAAAAPAGDGVGLPAPDMKDFAVGYRPWQTIVLADNSQDVAYLAAAAVPEWPDPAAPPASAQAELPVPSLDDCFGGDSSLKVASP
jgi:peptidoglycan/xylan/chitin deacetylase (PgdA/CDA1 family)